MKKILLCGIIFGATLIGQSILAYDLSGNVSANLKAAYSLLSMSDYNDFAKLNKIQEINTAFNLSGDLLFNTTRDFAVALRGEYITGIPSGKNTDYTVSLILTPLLLGAVYRSTLTEDLSIVSSIYMGYAWGTWEYKKNTDTAALIATGGCFTGEGDINVLWRTPFEERLSAGISAGLRYSNVLAMKHTSYFENEASTPITGGNVITASGKDLNFDMSGFNFGICLIYDL